MEKTRAHLLISGRVQGVCFRMVTEEEALNRRLKGWVRNLPTGQVEILLEGEKKDIEDMIVWCHQGPTAARVTEVKVEWQTYLGDFRDFCIIH